MKRIGRTAMFPDYLPKQFRDRRLGYVADKTVYLETGETFILNSYEDINAILFDKDCLLFLDQFTPQETFPFLGSFISDDRSKVLSTKTGEPTAIRVSRAQQSRWIIHAPMLWDMQVSPEFLQLMRSLYRYCAVGVRPTPSSVGTSLLRAIWKLAVFHKQTAPNVLCQDYLHEHGVGGRCDTPGKGKHYDSLIELDAASAYLAHFMSLPGGTAHGFFADPWHFATFFAKCSITIHHELALGPFPIKRGRSANIVYPTLPGTYTAYLWREQIEDCLQAGCDVKIHGGYGWRYLTDVTEYWCKHMYWLKTLAPSDDIEDILKKVIVATIGRFGTRGIYYYLAGDGRPEEPAMLGDDMQPYPFYVRTEEDYTSPSMIHWFNYCIMQCARTLYHFALPYAIEGRLVMTNYDAVLVIERDESHTYIEKHTLASKSVAAGDWRWQRLTNVDILGPRSLRCDQKIVTPGIPEEERILI